MASEVVIIVSHDLDPIDAERSAARINGNGARMAQMPGFIDRQLFRPEEGAPSKLVTITRWQSREAYDAWVSHNQANNPNAGTPAPFKAHPPEILTAYNE
jgi:heme-degrading monooxygenase HmoA